MIEMGIVDGKKAVLAYVNDKLEPVDKRDATLLVASLEDGRKLFLINKQPVQDIYEDPDYIQGEGGRMFGSRSRAGPGFKERKTTSGMGAAPKKPKVYPQWLKEIRETKDANGETVQDMLDRKATPDEIAKHPAYAMARAKADSIPLTVEQEGYGTKEWRDARRFTPPDGEEFTSYKEAYKYLEAKSESYAKGPVGYDHEATIVLGPPASGKSGVAEAIARAKKSAIVDSDDAKAILPEFQGGIGANGVHNESGTIADTLLDFAMARGKNVTIPRVGGSYQVLDELVVKLKDKGYKVNLVNMEVHEDEAFRRGIGRFLETGRLIQHEYTKKVDGLPGKVFAQMAKTDRFEQLVVVDANGPKGQNDIPLGKEGEIGRALARAGYQRP